MMALLPPDIHAIAAILALIALAYTAIVDARTGMVPPLPLAVASLLLIASLVANGATPMAIVHAALMYAGIWAVNEAHYRMMGRDALGMGDAHWSFVATLLYGPVAVLWAWGAGACLAILFLGARRLAGKSAGQVYFVPFLFIGLLLVRLAL
jgi:prepilin signal peptidase PulO-like enzyme (type II secretory pathway)